jgi:DNA modification methylase
MSFERLVIHSFGELQLVFSYFLGCVSSGKNRVTHLIRNNRFARHVHEEPYQYKDEVITNFCLRVCDSVLIVFIDVHQFSVLAMSSNGIIDRGSTGKHHPNNILNDLTGEEWLFFTRSILRTSYPHEYSQEIRRTHGANKPPRLMKSLIEYFTKSGQTVLDPFAGVGGTLLGASMCGRRAVGIEINRKWIDIYVKVCEREGLPVQEMIHGDCLAVLPTLSRCDLFDFVVFDPPYNVDMKITMCNRNYGRQNRKKSYHPFSEDSRDISRVDSYEDYLDRVEDVFILLHPLVRKRGYIVIIIRDAYQASRYIFAGYDVTKRAERAGFVPKGDIIWYQSGSRLRPYGYPYAYVPNIVHQHILVLRKE